MGMLEWARKEVAIACERERNSSSDDGWDYGCACYESALKAFKQLCNQGHSGMSMSITQHILNRLIDGKPLTPIEDDEDMWNEVGGINKGYTVYQCRRMSSLFKDVYDDGTVVYSDINRFTCVDVETGTTYHSGLVDRTLNKLYPITMPYYPRSPFKVYCNECLTSPENGDFDTVAILYLVTPQNEKVTIEKFYKESDEGWIEISEDEYNQRVELDKQRADVAKAIEKDLI